MSSLVTSANSLPDDIALKIASSLQVLDVCSLGSCSRFWRELCASDYLWESLCKARWPGIAFEKDISSQEKEEPEIQRPFDCKLKGWRGFYISKHNEMAEKAATIVSFVERCFAFESIEVGNYLKAVSDLYSMQFSFMDVQMFFLKENMNVLLNLVGLHYCIIWLGVPADYVIGALDCGKISGRQVCVQWWKLGRWFYGFRLRDELHSRNVTLGDLATDKAEEVLGVLHRGAVHEVLRVQIAAAKPTSIPWSCQSIVKEED